jgi:hypothetical protein
LSFLSLRDQRRPRGIPDIRLVFSVTGTRPADSPFLFFLDERWFYRTIWPIYCPQIGAAATAIRQGSPPQQKGRPVRTALPFECLI